uniref:BZIP domain-containing protein n=1 Tax=Acrobeloides nanus TaxID=290746 RepID=A0A914CE19_9BILA
MDDLMLTRSIWLSSYRHLLEVPSTAEIIQKCLSINPFEAKFREANRRISQSSQEILEQNGLVPPTISLPGGNTAGITMLKLPSNLESPSIFSNINLLSADLSADMFGKSNLTLSADFQRKLQQVLARSATDGSKTPCTADVLNAVLDMNMTQNLNAVSQAQNESQVSAPGTSATDTNGSTVSSLTSGSNTLTTLGAGTTFELGGTNTLGFPFSTSSGTLCFLPPMASIISTHAPVSNPQSLYTGANIPSSSLVPPSVLVGSPSSTRSISPRSNSTANLMELKKATSASNISETGSSVSDSIHSSEVWEQEVKPNINALKLNATGSDPHMLMHSNPGFYSGESAFPGDDRGSVSRRHDEGPPTKRSKVNDNQVTSSRGGRGRRSLTSELPPDERRNTILERNKAAAVRYRKRKKEEHDEMIGRVHIIEQEKVALATQNSVLRRELERLTELLKMRDARCICRANTIGTNSLLSDARADSPVDIDTIGQHEHSAFVAQMGRRMNH